MSIRQLPQNLELERALLGILISRNDSLFDISGIMQRTDFFEPAHGEIYTLIRDLIETGRSATPATLMHDFSQNADIGGITAAEYLATMEREAPAPVMAQTFARTIRDLALRRKLIQIAQEHIEEAYSAPATISAIEIEARFTAGVSGLFQTIQETGILPLAEISRSVLKDAQKVLQGETRRGVSFGMKALDDLCGPLLPGRLISLAGSSGSGKTSLAWQIARHVAKDVPVLFQSIEMDGSELAVRDLGAESGVDQEKIDRAQLSVSEFYSLIEHQEKQKFLRLYVDSAKTPTVGSIRGKALRMQRKEGLGLILIDHLRYIRSSDRRADVFEAMNQNLQALNAMADDLEVPVLLICQLKADFGREPKLRDPHVGDIFNAGVIEQESDVLLIVHREEFLLARREPPRAEAETHTRWATAMMACKDRAKLILNKRRGGKGYGARLVGFDGPTQRFTDELPAHPWTMENALGTDDGGRIEF